MVTYKDEIEIIDGTIGKDVNLQAQDKLGNSIDLSGCTVKWIVYVPEATYPVLEVTCTAVDLSTGKVKYALLITNWSTSGTADSGSETTTVDTERTEASDFWIGAYIRFTSGLNIGLERRVTAFNSGTDTITHEAFPDAVVVGNEYVLVRLEGTKDYTSSLIADKTGYHEEFKNLKVIIKSATPTT